MKWLRWVKDSILGFLIRSGEYGPSYTLGLLHHLEMDDHTNLLRRCSDTLALLDRRITPDIAKTKGLYKGMYEREVSRNLGKSGTISSPLLG